MPNQTAMNTLPIHRHVIAALVLLNISLPSASAIEHVRVLWMKNPAKEAVISWTTREEGKAHQVHFDTVSRNGDAAAYANRAKPFKSGGFTMIEEDQKWVKPGFFHHVHLKDLKPATAYYLTVESDGQFSREFHFATAFEEDREFAVLFGGDSRIEGKNPYLHNDRRKMNERMRSIFTQNPLIMALVHGGDYCERAEWRYLDAWLTDHTLTTTEKGRLLPIIPARGNHDVQVGFVETFSWPDLARPYYYTTRLSPKVALVTLNTEISMAGDQRNWLEKELPELRKENRWLFASYHRTAFPSVRDIQDGASRRNNFVPAFEQSHLDLACESHDHALKRTLPIRDNKPDHENGIVYIGDGGLGVPQRKPDPSRWWFANPGFTKPTHHVHMIEFGKERMRVRAFGMEGDTLDDFSLQPRAVKTP